MAVEVKDTPEVLIGGHVSSEPAIGAYANGNSSFMQYVKNKTPYSLLEKTGKLPDSNDQERAKEVSDALFARLGKSAPPKDATQVFDGKNRWLRELGITSADKIDFQKAWETDNFRRQKSEHEWRDTYGGKLAIRTFSRGILGSVFFTAGQHIAGTGLKDYAYDPLDASKNSKLHNPLEYVARLFDVTLGKGIYKTTYFITKDAAKAKSAVTFRHTNHWQKYGEHADGSHVMGRSYGHEGLAITFDFGLASLGDFMGREIAGLIDPNTEKKWMKDGHVDLPMASKALLKSMWTGVSKAMGEDYFAMAAGYPYVVRYTRNIISKYSPGFEYDSDRWGNGGSFKIDKDGKIIGNYQLEGMTDLGIRFSAYNVLTKIYRDGYDKAANKVKHFWEGDRSIHLPHLDTIPTPANMLKKAADGISSAVQYLVRTTIKVSIIMIPSSAVFAFIRSSQSKDIGLAINPEKGPVGIGRGKDWTGIYANGGTKADGKRSAANLNEHTEYLYKDGTPANFSSFAPIKAGGYESRFDPYGQVTPETQWHDRFTNPVGRFCHEGGHTLTEIVKPIARFFGGKDMDAGNISRHVQRFFDATAAYTPYFMAKTDILSTAYDTPRMDMGVDRMTSGIAHFNPGEFLAGGGEVIHVITNRPFNDPNREALAQKKMRTYTNQLWSNQDEIIAKEREEEYQERMDAMMSMGKPISMNELYRQPFAERVGRKGQDAANDPYHAQNITPIFNKKPEDYKKPAQEWKKQANGSWSDRAVNEFQNNTSSQGQTIN